jgi:uncharacterized protein
MDAYEPTERTRVRRKHGRARYERDLIHTILDQALICHVGFVEEAQPYVIPTIHARVGEVIYLHGSPASRTLGVLADGAHCCVTVTLIDDLVLARSARQHSLNYRSVVVLGQAREVSDQAEKAEAMRAVVEHIAPGRSDQVRGPNASELDSTRILALPIEEASAKVREGPPVDKPDDLDPEIWAGRLPLTIGASEPIGAADLRPGLNPPSHVSRWAR